MSAAPQPELPGMPERPATPPAHRLVLVLSVTLEARGLDERGLVELAMATTGDTYRAVAQAFVDAGAPGDPDRYVKVLGTGGGIAARYGEPGAYERAVERAARAALAAS